MLTVFKKYLQDHTPITDEQFEQLSREVTPRSYPKGRILVKPGDTSDNGYFVSKGLLRAYATDEKGKEHIIQFAPENWWIGDRGAMYFGEPATFYVDVVEDAEVVVVNRNFMDRAQEICPAYARYNIYLLHNTARHMQQRIASLLAATAEERYLSFIHMYPNVMLRVPQLMVASYLGITPETLSRVRKELARKNFGK
ncbi:Crp/Fnr family transcriptional regulator [Chitinophaga lutea]|uniref:Crp/Fnr family transcriptional regulator n=1 Tax=Chitinophaga lutea TaxID=2488634 RepID=UPI0015F2CAD1|nr:Crp/Fnr family transcriptional regulator [Chitinophaga lutea]